MEKIKKKFKGTKNKGAVKDSNTNNNPYPPYNENDFADYFSKLTAHTLAGGEQAAQLHTAVERKGQEAKDIVRILLSRQDAAANNDKVAFDIAGKGNKSKFCCWLKFSHNYRSWLVVPRATKFMTVFAQVFETKLDAYAREYFQEGPGKAGKTANLISGIGKGAGEVAGLVGSFFGVGAAIAGTLKGAGKLAAPLISILMEEIGSKEHLSRVAIIRAVFDRMDRGELRRSLVLTGARIFCAFQHNLVELTGEKDWTKELVLYVVEAVDRILNYVHTHSDAFSVAAMAERTTAWIWEEELFKAFLAGNAKGYLGTDKNWRVKKFNEKWKKLVSCSGIWTDIWDKDTTSKAVQESSSSAGIGTGYRLEEGQDPNKYGFRRVFDFEGPMKFADQDKFHFVHWTLHRSFLDMEELRKMGEDLLVDMRSSSDEILGKLDDILENLARIEGMFSTITQFLEVIKGGVDFISGRVVEMSSSIVQSQQQPQQKLLWIPVTFQLSCPTPHFVGRKNLLLELRAIVASSTPQQQQPYSITVVVGKGGTGKTELVKKYLSQVGDEEDHNLIFIHGQDMSNAFAELKKRLGGGKWEEEKVPGKPLVHPRVYTTLTSQYRTTIVFDDVDSFETIARYIPPPGAWNPAAGGGGHRLDVIVTSWNNGDKWRQSSATTTPSVQIVELQEFPLAVHECVSLFKKIVGIDKGDNAHQTSLETLMEKLRYIPAQVWDAGLFVKLVKSDEQGLLVPAVDLEELINVLIIKASNDNDGKSMSTILLEKIKKGNENVELLLRVLGYLDPSRIPRSLLKGLVITHPDKESSSSGCGLMIPTSFELDKALARLLEYNVLRMRGEVGIYEISRSRQTAIQDIWRDDAEGRRKENVRLVLELLERKLNLPVAHTRTDQPSVPGARSLRSYSIHLLSVWEFAVKYDDLCRDYAGKGIADSNFAYEVVSGRRHGTAVTLLENLKDRLVSETPSKCFVRRRDGRTLVHGAAFAGNEEGVEFLIQLGTDVKIADARGDTPLHLAAKHGRLDVVRAILGALSPGEINGLGEAEGPSSPACSSPDFGNATPAPSSDGAGDATGNLEANQQFASTPTSIHSKVRKIPTPLHLAAQAGHWQVVQALLEAGADVNAKWCPQQQRSENNLRSNNSNPDEKTVVVVGADPLLLAVERGHIAAARVLLESRDLNPELLAIDDKGDSVLHKVAAVGQLQLTKMVCARFCPVGANNTYKHIINAQNKIKNTPLHVAVASGRSPGRDATVHLLLNCGADPNIPNGHTLTPLHIAAKNNEGAIGRMLLEGAVLVFPEIKVSRENVDTALRHWGGGSSSKLAPLLEEYRQGLAYNDLTSNPSPAPLDTSSASENAQKLQLLATIPMEQHQPATSSEDNMLSLLFGDIDL